MTDEKKQLTKEEKIQKATNLLKEVANLQLVDDELKAVVGGSYVAPSLRPDPIVVQLQEGYSCSCGPCDD